ncbi:pilus assembly protein PilP [Ramlibacter rhizophilus]|uniref:Pilus assembly protein PilP n=1 Tax=Ramlibacter rhizophilus TaxID=1781167 RepID=A0A4Z0BML4_9BURK|nr:pilus assembly protein PilP [Ramlibacter rhizophilus]TFZ00022.1 pilus assembly protein PilP [Ramlibacter rhizophilus]
MVPLASRRLGRIVLVSLAAALVAGCGAGGDNSLATWMQQQRAEVKPKIEPIAPPKAYTPERYSETAAADPFGREKLTQALRRESGQATNNSTLLAPELARRKEPLESVPLDNMAMVGTLFKQGKPVALIKVDNLLYQVRPGQYMGQNYGRVTKVSESEVVLREIVQDPVGDWVERVTTMQLQERAQ